MKNLVAAARLGARAAFNASLRCSICAMDKLSTDFSSRRKALLRMLTPTCLEGDYRDTSALCPTYATGVSMAPQRARHACG